MGFKTWTEAARIAIDRKLWKDTIKSPVLQVERGTKRESSFIYMMRESRRMNSVRVINSVLLSASVKYR